MNNNETATFLGQEYTWSRAGIELSDVHPLFGGVHVRLPGFTISQAFVTRVAPGGGETKYKLSLGWDEKEDLCRLCVENDLLTVRRGEQMPVPDEALPVIALSNRRRERRAITRPPGGGDPRFDAVYEALLAIAARTEGRRPMPTRFNGWQKALVVAAVGGVLLLLVLLAYALAAPLVAAWWPGRFWLLFLLLLLLLPLFLAALRSLAWIERRRSRWDRSFTHPSVVIAANLLFFLAGIGALGLAETAFSLWRGGVPLAPGDERDLYALLGYTALFAACLLVGAAGLVGRRLWQVIDERF